MVVSKSLRERIADRIAAEVSPNCMHRLPTGRCQQPADLPCPITSNIDGIIDIVRSVSSDQIGLYVDRLRETVCRKCPMQDESGQCRLRDSVDCCLDALLVLVVTVVEEEIEREP